MKRQWIIRTVLLLALAPVLSAVAQPNQARMPSFSWNHVPLYMHVQKMKAFTPAEIRYMATFPIVVLEKETGVQDFGSTEKGVLAAATAIKAVNPTTKVLYYLNAVVAYDDYDANTALKAIPDAFWRKSSGNYLMFRNRYHAYNLTNSRVRDWWVDDVRKVCSNPAVDGVFVDGVIKVDHEGPEQIKGFTAMMKATRRALGPDKLMIANLLRAQLPDSGLEQLHLFDGSYLERWDVPMGNVPMKDYVAKGIAAFQEAARQGYLIAFTAGLGAKVVNLGAGLSDSKETPAHVDAMRKRFTSGAPNPSFSYDLAVFLICADKHSYFYAHSGYRTVNNQAWMAHPPDYDRPLGPPKGPAVRSGYIYTREFAHASVRLDVANQTGTITWKAP